MSDLMAPLQCPRCGGKLTHTAVTQRYRCEYCGTEHVARRDGLVYFGPDKIASEAAIKRLTAEIAELEAELQKYMGASEAAQAAVKPLELTISNIKVRIYELYQQLAAARRFNDTLQIGVIYLVIMGLFWWGGAMPAILNRPNPTFVNWVMMVLGALVVLSPMAYVFSAELNRARKLPKEISEAEAHVERQRAVIQERLAAAAAAYPAAKVEALKAEILERKRQLAVHYEVVAN